MLEMLTTMLHQAVASSDVFAWFKQETCQIVRSAVA